MKQTRSVNFISQQPNQSTVNSQQSTVNRTIAELKNYYALNL